VSVRIILISTVSVIIQLGLTVLAWGNWNSFFSHPARTWLVIGSFLLLILAWFSGSAWCHSFTDLSRHKRGASLNQ
jgi:hypothetical protein